MQPTAGFSKKYSAAFVSAAPSNPGVALATATIEASEASTPISNGVWLGMFGLRDLGLWKPKATTDVLNTHNA